MARRPLSDLAERLRRSRIRLRIATGFLMCAFAAVAVRLVVIAISAAAPEGRVAARDVVLLARADLLDRNGVVLATDLPISSLVANTRHIWDPVEAADDLVRTLPGLSRAQLLRDLSSGQSFVWIKRGVTPRQHAAVRALGIAGLSVQHETRRIYPNGQTAAHVLGFVDIDNRGLAGLERGLDTMLRDPARNGAPVVLSLDLRVQHVLEDELKRAIAHFQAVGAVGLVTDVNTGEILAMASLPDFDPNRPTESPQAAIFNQATLGVYEMGSTFKAFTVAMMLEQKLATFDTAFDARHPIFIGGRQIKDFMGAYRILSLHDVFVKSSNIGTAQMARVAGAARQQAFLRSLGLFAPAELEIPEIGRPGLPRRWGEVQAMTISYGHGIAVSPVQLASAFAAMANGGLLVRPTLLKRAPEATIPAKRVISEETSAKMRQLLHDAVMGGARLGAVDGYPVGGKTGTAEKTVNGSYLTDARRSSFAGVFPAFAPRYLVFVMLDDPKPTPETNGYATGGRTAAPTTAKIIARIAPLLGIPPELPPAADPDTALAAAGGER